MTRRTFLAAPALAQPAQREGPGESVIARADLVYDKPAERSEEGIPIGNGRMGTLVWTTPTSIHLQINRADVYANDSYTTSFFERHSDYCGGCAFVDIRLAGAGDEVFPAAGFPQRLSVYDGALEIRGRGVTVRLFASPEIDVIAIELEDRRAARQPVEAILRMLRPASVETRNHTAVSRLQEASSRSVLIQEFREGDFCCRSAVAVAPGATIFISSAATFDPREDVAGAALRLLDAARTRGIRALSRAALEWWHAFWSQGYVEMSSADGAAALVERHYHWYLYLMASTSRGKFPPKFNGMLWTTAGDQRTWGAQHWFANLSCYYEALPAANRLELMDPAFDMYSGARNAAATAARQQWGSQGIYIPETMWFNGLASLPEEIAAEMRDLYLLRKPWEQRSARFRDFAAVRHPHSSRWNWIDKGQWVDGRWVFAERGSGPYGPVNHILGTTGKVAYLFWRRYEYTLDREWLRTRAYPMLKGAAEFYRHFPNLSKGSDGFYHIHHVNSNESVWGARDTDEDLSAMRGVFPALLRASEILGVDAGLRPAWREFLDHLAPLPTSDDPDALRPADYQGPRVFVRGRKPAIKAAGLLPDANSLPMWFFDLAHVETRDRRLLETARATFRAYFRNGITEQTPVGVLSKLAIAAAALGEADAVRFLIPNQIRVLRRERESAYRGGAMLTNRMTLREGAQALDAEALGRAAEALQLALLQSYPPAPAEEPVLHLFPAWPKEWNARFQLRARNAFVVRSAIRNGKVEFVELDSEAGARCRLRNPWGEAEITVTRDGKPAGRLRGGLVEFGTRRGEIVRLVGGH